VTGYFDTSAFVKLLVPEPGSSHVASLWLRADRRVSSLLLYPEARAAIHRAQRLGRVGGRGVSRAVRRLEALWEGLYVIGVTEELARRAGALAQTHGLRAYDAVHLASVTSAADDEVVLVAADGDLLAAASTIGLVTAPVW
jgi:predicted nucleic acid-binding protein